MVNQTAMEFDEQVTLTCEASGDPTPTISWSFQNTVFTEGEQVPFLLFFNDLTILFYFYCLYIKIKLCKY